MVTWCSTIWYPGGHTISQAFGSNGIFSAYDINHANDIKIFCSSKVKLF